MRQVLLQAPGEFVDRQVPSPRASTGQALVQIRAVGVCGSDFHAFAGRHPAYTYPRVLGHELSGTVVDAPRNDEGIEVGDHCAVEPYISCGMCRACKAGRKNCCEQLRVIGIHVDGGMQPYLSVPLALLHKSTILSPDQLALVETLGIGAHAVLRSQLRNGEEALVIGVGPIGLAAAQFAQAAGAKVRVIERNEWRRTFAARLGFESQDEYDDRMADVVFDATGNANSMGVSLRYAAPAGRVVYVGLTRDKISFDNPLFHMREMTLYASRNSSGQFPRIIKMIEEHKIDISRWITNRIALSEVPTRFENLPNDANLIKAIVDIDEIDI